MIRYRIALLVNFLFITTAIAEPLETLWQNKDLWEQTTESFVQAAGSLGFRWNSANHDSARSTSPSVTLAGLPVVETVVHLTDGKISGITVSLFNKGDSGDLGRPEFEALVKRCVEGISTLSGVRAQVRGKDSHNAVKADGVIWQTPQTLWLLEYAMARNVTGQAITYKPDFVRLELSPVKKAGLAAGGGAGGSGKVDPKSHVKHSATGDVWIDGIPMVDQGEKGYCVVASAERVLRYYGIRTDQNELAQLAGSDRSKGTLLSAAIDGLKQAGNRLHFRTRALDDPDIREFETLVNDYNRRVSKIAKDAQIPPLKGEIDPFQILASMKIEILKEVRLNQKAAMGRFVRTAAASVEAGQPLMWGVALGLTPEAGQVQSVGGHVRLIVGYNAAKNELLYSDSWGAGHELKRMSMDDAWLIHRYLLQLTPW